MEAVATGFGNARPAHGVRICYIPEIVAHPRRLVKLTEWCFLLSQSQSPSFQTCQYENLKPKGLDSSQNIMPQETLGYYNLVELSNGYIGGLLVIDPTGKPLEFRVTTTPKPANLAN